MEWGRDVALCTLQELDGVAVLGVHVVPWTFRQRVHEALTRSRWELLLHLECLASEVLTRVAMDAMALRRTRELLESLDYLRHKVQGQYDRLRRSQARVPGGRPACLASIPHPLLAHDACTLYSSLLLSVLDNKAKALAHVAGTASLPPSCDKCGAADSWTVSCYKPRVSVRGGTTYFSQDQPMTWCWNCRADAPSS